MKRFLAVICVLFVACFLVTGCGDDGKPFLIDSIGRNFFAEEFDENYTHYEDDLNAPKRAESITVTGHVISGVIELKLIEKDKGGKDVRSFEFTITDELNETIELEKKHSANWVMISEHFEDTEGGFEAAIFG